MPKLRPHVGIIIAGRDQLVTVLAKWGKQSSDISVHGAQPVTLNFHPPGKDLIRPQALSICPNAPGSEFRGLWPSRKV